MHRGFYSHITNLLNHKKICHFNKNVWASEERKFYLKLQVLKK